MDYRHRDKVALARKMLTKKEVEDHVGIFQSSAWTFRKYAIAMRLAGTPVRSPQKLITAIMPKVGMWARFKLWLSNLFVRPQTV